MSLSSTVTKTNPFVCMRFLAPAQTMTFACVNSAGIIPMTKSVRSTGRVPLHCALRIFPLGATVNMDGSATYFHCACICLAVLLNHVDEINASHFHLLVIISTIGKCWNCSCPFCSFGLGRHCLQEHGLQHDRNSRRFPLYGGNCLVFGPTPNSREGDG
jgi:hypothetical protein